MLNKCLKSNILYINNNLFVSSNPKNFTVSANDILNFNPVNYKVRFFLLSKAIERFQKGLHLDKHAEVLQRCNMA